MSNGQSKTPRGSDPRKKRKAKPVVLKLLPKSDRLVTRMACLLAFQALTWTDRESLKSKARELIERMKEVQP